MDYTASLTTALPTQSGRAEASEWIQRWQSRSRLSDDLVAAVAKLEDFCGQLQDWIASRTRISPRDLEALLLPMVLPELAILFAALERAAHLPAEVAGRHRDYARRRLHAFVLQAPIFERAFTKPLGYPGDYVTAQMTLRNDLEGETVLGRLLHFWYVQQPTAQAQRNRFEILAADMQATQQAARGELSVVAVGCGPAIEATYHMRLAGRGTTSKWIFLDFDPRALEIARSSLERAASDVGAQVQVQTIQCNIDTLLIAAQAAKVAAAGSQNMVYCGGLFDYLPDRTCRTLLARLYDWLAPGGLLVAANVMPSNPLRTCFELLLDWNLVHRDEARLRQLWEGDGRTYCDATGVSGFLEIRKA